MTKPKPPFEPEDIYTEPTVTRSDGWLLCLYIEEAVELELAEAEFYAEALAEQMRRKK